MSVTTPDSDEERTPKERTYKDLGDCSKCGDKGTYIRWRGPWLGVACNRCGIKWPVQTKDEL